GCLIEQVRDGLLRDAVLGAAVVHDRDVDPSESQLARQRPLADGERMLGRMRQCQDGPELLVADEPSHRPGLLPGPAKDLARLDHPELLQEYVVVAVSPELLGAEARRACDDGPTDPDASVDGHGDDLPP